MPAKSSISKGNFDIQQLAALLPAGLGEWTLATLGQPIPSVMPEPLPAIQATYIKGQQTAIVSLNTSMPQGVAKGSRAIQHERIEARKQNVATLPLSNGLVITASSHMADGPALVQLLQAIDLERAEKLTRSGK